MSHRAQGSGYPSRLETSIGPHDETPGIGRGMTGPYLGTTVKVPRVLTLRALYFGPSRRSGQPPAGPGPDCWELPAGNCLSGNNRPPCPIITA